MLDRLFIRAMALSWFVLGLAAWPAFAANPVVGVWTLTALQPRQEVTIWLIQLQEEEGRLVGKVLSALSETELERAQVKDGELHLTLRMNALPYVASVVVPANEREPRRLLGSLEARGRRDLLRMDRSQLKQLDMEKVTASGGPATDALERAAAIENPKERESAMRALVKQYAEQPAGIHLALGMVETLADGGVNEADFRANADLAIKYAARHGRAMEMQATQQCADELIEAKRLPSVALDYSKKASRLLKETDSNETKVRVLKVEAKANRLATKIREAEEIERRLTALERQLDDEFERSVLTFPAEPLPGRSEPGQRVVLVELFTGAQCPPCVAADVAFLGLTKSAKPNQVVFLQYHLHAPFPDPLTNPDSEKRGAYYQVGGTPFLLINGEWCQRPDDKGVAQGVGGLMQHAGERYRYLRQEVIARQAKPVVAQLQLKAERRGSHVDVRAEVADLKRTGEDVRLRLALVEEVVRYPGTNGQRLHHHVVRGFLGSVEGMPLRTAITKHTASVDVATLRQNLAKALEEYHKIRKFPDGERPLNLERLKVIAFIQDDKTKEVLQATQLDLPAAAR